MTRRRQRGPVDGWGGPFLGGLVIGLALITGAPALVHAAARILEIWHD